MKNGFATDTRSKCISSVGCFSFDIRMSFSQFLVICRYSTVINAAFSFKPFALALLIACIMPTYYLPACLLACLFACLLTYLDIEILVLGIEVSLTLSLQCSVLLTVFDLCVPMMEKGEVCEVVSHARYVYGSVGRYPNVPPFTDVHFHIELLDFTNESEYSSLTVKLRTQMSNEKKLQGNTLFKRHEYWRAIELYKKAAIIIENVDDGREELSKCYNNMAAAQMKVNAWDDAILSCGRVLRLEPQNTKALFREASCFMNKCDFATALRLFTVAAQLEPSDKTIQKELKKCENILKDTERRNRQHAAGTEKEMCRRMMVECNKEAEIGRQLQRPVDGVSLTSDNSQVDIITGDCSERVRAKMPCGHIVGPQSLFEYCSSLLSDGQYEVECPESGCSALWDYPIIRHVACLTDAEQQQMEQRMSINYLTSTQGRVNIKACPGCGWDCILQGGVTCGNMVNCPVCTAKRGYIYDFCWNCLKEWRDGSECNGSRCSTPSHNVIYQLQNCQTKLVVYVMCPSMRACPGCCSLIEYAGGCAHVQCQNCSYYFCFICLRMKNPVADNGLIHECYSRRCLQCRYIKYTMWLMTRDPGKCSDCCYLANNCMNVAPRQTSLNYVPLWRQYLSSLV